MTRCSDVARSERSIALGLVKDDEKLAFVSFCVCCQHFFFFFSIAPQVVLKSDKLAEVRSLAWAVLAGSWSWRGRAVTDGR